MEALASISQSTFRDPAGSVELRPDGVFRSVRADYVPGILSFLNSPLASALVADGHIVSSEIVCSASGDMPLLLRHPRVSFLSYPSEWPPSLWLSAAELTLDLCTRLLKEGWILKDATPLNVLFDGTKPVFVDILSIQKLDADRPIWFAYGQFVRTFLLPLLAHSQLGWPLQTATTRRDGFEPEEIFAALPWFRRFKQPALTSVTLPRLLANKKAIQSVGTATYSAADPEITRQVITNTLSSLRSAMQKAMPPPRTSAWSSYAETASHYSNEDHASKRRFILAALEYCRPDRVLDIGCNTGVYSRIAASAGAQVVSIDADGNAIERLARELGPENQSVLPLCIDLAHPTPSTGWQNQEHASFLQRCEGHFDTVLMLAVIHHLAIGSQIPPAHIAALCSRVTTRNLILELVPPSDPKFVEILRGREALYSHLTNDFIQTAFAEHFDTAAETTLHNGRLLLHLIKK